jgi:hypothetical protein
MEMVSAVVADGEARVVSGATKRAVEVDHSVADSARAQA